MEKGSNLLNGKNMDGLDLSGIFGMLQPVLPLLSYYLNLMTKMFDIFASYLGIDLSTPLPEGDSSNNENIEDGTV